MSSYLSAMEPDHVSTLEQEVARLQAREVETDNKFAQILEAMACLSQPTQQLNNTPSVTPISVS